MSDRSCRPSPRIGTVENYHHHWLFLIWFAYFAGFILVEHLVPTTGYWVSYIPLDDRIPFVPAFILCYCMWFPLLAAMSLYLAFFDAVTFKKFMLSIALGFLPVLLFNYLFPNGQDLRPVLPAQKDLFTFLIAGIYAADTNTNVMPSMHVIGCADLVAAAVCCPALKKRKLHWVMLVLGILVSVSTVFIKQHSVLDLLAALPYSALVLLLVYLPKKKA